MKKCLFFILLFFTCATWFSQNPKKILDSADFYFKNKQYVQASLLYEQYLDSTSNKINPALQYNTACSFSLSGNTTKAFEHLYIAIDQGWSDTSLTFSDKDLLSLHQLNDWKLLKIEFNNKLNERKTDFGWGIYFGILFILFFYNLFLLLMLRTKVYFFYTLLILVFAQLDYATNPSFAVFTGDAFFWMGLFKNVQQPFLCFASLATIVYLFFVREFLQLKSYSKKLDVVIKILIFCLSIHTLLTYFLRFPIREVTYILWLICYGVAIFSGVYCWRKKYRPARFFVLAAAFHTIGVFLGTANDIGLINFDITFGVLKSYNLGGIGFLISLALAIGDQINILKKDKENAQRIAMEKLEEKVKERTLELKEQKALIEEKNKEVMDSIRYASRIQRALITNVKYIERNLKKLNSK